MINASEECYTIIKNKSQRAKVPRVEAQTRCQDLVISTPKFSSSRLDACLYGSQILWRWWYASWHLTSRSGLIWWQQGHAEFICNLSFIARLSPKDSSECQHLTKPVSATVDRHLGIVNTMFCWLLSSLYMSKQTWLQDLSDIRRIDSKQWHL